MGADYYNPESGKTAPGIGSEAYIDGALIDKNVVVGKGVRIVASEAPATEGNFGSVSMRDGIAVVRRSAVIPDGWSLKDAR